MFGLHGMGRIGWDVGGVGMRSKIWRKHNRKNEYSKGLRKVFTSASQQFADPSHTPYPLHVVDVLSLVLNTVFRFVECT